MGISALQQRQNKSCQRVLAYLFSSVLAFHPFIAYGGDIVTNGLTATNVDRNGNVVSITTETIKGNSGFNAFSQFDVDAGNTVNLYLPDSTGNLINLVYDKQSDINGVLNSIKDGEIGGNVYFANPYGMVVGENGSINVGSFSLTTPTTSWMDNFFSQAYGPSPLAVEQLIQGNVPLSASGLVSIKGKINALDDISIAAGQINLAGSLNNGANFRANFPDFSDVVNVAGLETATAIRENNGVIEIYAATDIDISGEISAAGHGENEDGGTVSIMAEGKATLAEGAVIDASAGTSGNGGFIEFSAKEKVVLAGGQFNAGAESGEAGLVYIDPDTVDVSGLNTLNGNTNLLIEADEQVIVHEGAIVSSRNISDVNNGNHNTDVSLGNSGDITIYAPDIDIEQNVQILAHATNNFEAGDVFITNLRPIDVDSIDPLQFEIAGFSLSDILGDGNDLQGLIDTLGLSEKDVSRLLNTDSTVDISIGTTGGTQTLITGDNVTVHAYASDRFGFTKNANATVNITNTRIDAENLAIAAESDTFLYPDFFDNTTDLDSFTVDPNLFVDNYMTSLGIPDSAFYVSTTSTADTQINGDQTNFNVNDNLQVNALARNSSIPFSTGFIAGLEIIDAVTTATVAVNDQANLQAGQLNLDASAISKFEAESDVAGVALPLAFSLAITDVVSTANVSTGSNTVLSADSIAVNASSSTEVLTSALAEKHGGNSLVTALAISDITSTATAVADGSLTSDALDVSATVESVRNATKASGGSTGKPGLGDKFNNLQQASKGLLLSKALSSLTSKNDQIADLAFPQMKSGKLNIAGAIAIAETENTAHASLGATADAKIAGATKIDAQIKDSVNIHAGVKASSTGAALGGAMTIANYNNAADAWLENGAQLATRSLDVTSDSQIAYPWDFDYTSITNLYDKLTNGWESLLFTASAMNANKAEGAGVSASINSITYNNNASAYVGDGAQVEITSGGTGAMNVSATTETNLITVSGKNPLSKNESGLGGSVNVINVGGTTKAYIEDNVIVNTDLPATNLDLSVKADATINTISVAESGGSSEKIGVDGAVAYLDVDQTTNSYIAQNADIDATTVALSSDTDVALWNIAGGFVKSGAAGVGISAAINDVDVKTKSVIGDEEATTISAQDTVDADSVTVDARADGVMDAISIAGALVSNKDEKSDGIFQKFKDAKKKVGDKLDSLTTSVNGMRDSSSNNSSSGSSGGSTPTEPTPKPSFGIGVSGSASVNDVDFDTKASIENAKINTTELALNAINTVNIDAISGSASFVKAKASSAKNTAAFAGAFASNDIQNTTEALIDNSQIINAESVDIVALTGGEQLSVALGMAVNASGNSGNSASVAGSVSISKNASETNASVVDSTITGNNSANSNANVVAYDKTELGVGGGSLFYGGKGGIGAAVSLSEINNTITSTINNSTLNQFNDISVRSLNAAKIGTGAAMAGGGSGTNSLAGSFVFSEIGNTTSIYVNNNSIINAADQIDILASDIASDNILDAVLNSGAIGSASEMDYNGTEVAAADAGGNSIVAVAGLIQVGKNNIGVSVVSGEISNTVTTNIDSSNLTAGTTLDVNSVSNAAITEIAIGVGGGTGSLSANGSVVVSDIGNEISATTNNSTLNASSLAVKAKDNSTIDSLAGNISASSKVAIGASVASSTIHNSVNANINGGIINVSDTVDLESESDDSIQNLAAAGGAAGKVAVGVSISINDIDNSSTAGLSNANFSQTFNSIKVQASDDSTIQSLAGSVNGAGTAAAGAAIAVNTSDSSVDAFVNDIAGMNVANFFNIDADTSGTIESIAVAGGGAGTTAFGGSSTTNIINNTTNASLLNVAATGTTANVNITADDESTIKSLAGTVMASGTASVGASVAVNEIDNQTGANIEGSTTNLNVGNVTVDANGNSLIQTIAAGVAVAGQVGVAGSVAVNLLGNQLDAHISDDALVTADGNVAVRANSSDNIDVIAGAVGVGIGAAGLGASVSVNDIQSTTKAYIEGENTSITARANNATGAATSNGIEDFTFADSIASLAAATENGEDGDGSTDASYTKLKLADKLNDATETRGIVVNATSAQNVDAYGGTAGVGTYVGVGATANINILGGQTEAYINQANINNQAGANAAQQVAVVAEDHSYTNSFVGALGGGAVGLGAAADVSVLQRETSANIRGDGDINAAGALTVKADASQGANSIAVGAAGGGTALAASGSVLTFDANTKAYIENTDIDAGSVLVEALATNQISFFDFTAAIAGFGAGAAAFGVSISDNTTHAYISGTTGDDSVLTSSGEVQVLADSTTELDGKVISFAADSGFAGVAGMAAVNIVTSTTEASVSNARVGSSTADVNSLEISATDEISLNGFSGAAGVSGNAGIGAGASVNIVKSRVIADLNNSSVYSANAVDVSAESQKAASGFTATAGAGLTVGIGGAAGVNLFGSEVQGESAEELDNEGAGTLTSVNNFTSGDKTELLEGQSDKTISQSEMTRLQNASQSDVKTVSTSTAGQAQYRTGASISGNSIVNAGSVNVSANDYTSVDATVGGVGVGAVGIGGAFSLAEIKNNINAEVGSSAQVDANSISLLATANKKNGSTDVIDNTVFAGGLGIVGVGAAVGIANVENNINAQLGGNISASSVSVDAQDNSSAKLDAYGAAVGAAAVGVVIADTGKRTTVNAGTSDGATLDGANSIIISSASSGRVNSSTIAAAGGIVSGTGADATATDTSVVNAFIGDNNTVTTPSANVQIRAEAIPQVKAQSEGTVVAYGAAIGVSLSEATVATTVNAGIGNNSIVEVASLNINAVQNKPLNSYNAFADSLGVGGGLLVGINATTADAKNNSVISAGVGDGSSVTSTGTVTVAAESNSKQHSKVDAANGGIVALGANKAHTYSETTVSATLASTASVTVHNAATSNSQLNVNADSTEENTANSISGSGGVVSGVSSTAKTTTKATTTATIGGSNTNVITADVLNLHAEHTANVNSSVDSINASIAGASGAYASNTVNSTVESNILANSMVETGSLFISSTNNVVKNWLGTQNGSDATANVKSGSGGVFDAPAAESASTFKLDTAINIGDSALINASADGAVSGEDDAITMDVLNTVLARDKAELNSGGAISIARASSKMTANVNGSINIGENAIVSAEHGDVKAGSRLDVDMENRSSADSYGLAGAPEGDTYATLNGGNMIDLGDGSLLMADHGELYLAAGNSSQGEKSDTRLHTKVNLWNKTAIPMDTDPDARSITDVDNNVNIGENANVLAASDITLAADKGNVTLYAYGLGKDIYRETAAAVASGISNAFGGGDVSFDITSSVETNNNSSTIRVDGSVETSIHRDQFITIDYLVDDLNNHDSSTDENGVSTNYYFARAATSAPEPVRGQVIYEITSSDGVSYGSIVPKDVGKNLQERIQALRDLQGQYSQDSISYNALESEITFLERRLIALGYATEDNAGTLGAPGTSPKQLLQDSYDATQLIYNARAAELTDVNNDLSDVATAKQRVTNRATASSQLATELAKDEDDQDATLITSLQNQIAQYNTLLANDGLPETTSELNVIQTDLTGQQTDLVQITSDLQDSLDGTLVQIASASDEVTTGPISDFLTIDDIHVDLGNIKITADNLIGDGSILAPADGSITVENNTPIHMTLQDLVIDSQGGFITYNNFNVSNVTDINNVNQSQTANFSNFVTVADGAGDIDIESKYNVLAANRDYAGEFPGIAPDIHFGVTGEERSSIWNPQGSFSVKSAAGSLYFDAADVFAGQVNMEAKNGDFVQSYTDTFYHVGGNPQAIYDGSQTVGSGIVANGDVFISARYLNINSLIQSGIEQWRVNIGTDASIVLAADLSDLGFANVTQCQSFNAGCSLDPNDSSVALFGIGFANAFYQSTPSMDLFDIRPTGNDNIDAAYDAANQQILLDGLEVSGGYIQLFGQIMNTSSSVASQPGSNAGRLRVLDGYGQVDINNNSSFDIVVNTISTGRGVEGQIDITDIINVDANGNASFNDTSYTRVNGQVLVDTERASGVSTTAYTPHHNMRYVWMQGQDYTSKEQYHFTSNQLFGGIPIGSVDLSKYRISGPTPVGAAIPLDEGRYLDEAASVSTQPHASALSASYSNGADTWTTLKEWTECNWWTICIASKKHVLLQRSYGQTDITKESVFAANPIAIEFVGNESGGNIDINSTNNVWLAGSIFNESGNSTINSQGGIFQSSDTGILHTGTMNLTAVNDIRGNTELDNLRFEMTSELNATSTNGAVRLEQQNGDLIVGQVNAATTASLTAEGSIVTGTGSLISANRVELNAGEAIGSAAQMLNIATGYTDNFADADYGVNAVANDDIYLVNVVSTNNPDGHLLVDKVASRYGDVYIESAGDIIDNNTEEEIDSTAWNELLNFWNNVAVLGNDSDQPILNDPAFVALLDSGNYAELYASAEYQSLSNNGKKQVQTLISDEQYKNNGYQQYWQLRNQQTDPSVYDPNTAFTVSDKERETMEQQWTREGIATDQFDTLVAQLETDRTDLYHELHADVGNLNGGLYDQDFVFTLSTEEKTELLHGSSWSERELGLALSPGLLKEVTDTNPIIKNANISGNNIVLQANTGNIGNRETQIEVSANIDPATLTDAQRVALASAERADIEFEDDLIRVVRRRPVNVDTSALGGLSASAVNGYVYIGSEQDIVIDSVQAMDEARIKVAGNIIAGDLASGQLAHVTSGNLVLESADHLIGSQDNNFIVLVNTDSALTARSQEGIYIQDASSELALDTLFSRGLIELTSDGNIVDAFADDFININAAGINLHSGGNIGTEDDALDVEVGGNSVLNVDADGSVNIRNAFAPLSIGDIVSNRWIKLRSEATGSELVGSLTAADFISISSDSYFSMLAGSRITAGDGFTALLAGDLLMDDDSLISSIGEIDIEAGGNITLGGLLSTSNSANAISLSASGQIIDGGDLFLDLSAPNGGVSLMADGGIGIDNSLEIEAAIVNVMAETGDAIIHSDGDLNLNANAQTGSVIATSGGTLTTSTGISAYSEVNLRAENEINVDSISAGRGVTLSSPLITANISQTSTHAGPLRIRATDGYMRADNIDLQMTAIDAIIIERFWGDTATVSATARAVNINDALIKERATFTRNGETVVVDNTSPSAQKNNEVQIYPFNQHFSLSMRTQRVDTNAVIVRAQPQFFVTSPLGEDLSLFEYADNLLLYLRGTDNMPLNGFVAEQAESEEEENVLELPESGEPGDMIQLQDGVTKKDKVAGQDRESPDLKVSSIN